MSQSKDTHLKSVGYILWLFGFVYLLTCGIFGLGDLYDLWPLNEQVSLINSGA